VKPLAINHDPYVWIAVDCKWRVAALGLLFPRAPLLSWWPHYRLGPVHTCMYIRWHETGEWDPFYFSHPIWVEPAQFEIFSISMWAKSKFLFNVGLRQANLHRGGINLELSWFNIHCYLRGSWGIFGDSSVTLAQLQWWRARDSKFLVIRRSPFWFRPKQVISDSHGFEQIDPQIRVLNYRLQ